MESGGKLITIVLCHDHSILIQHVKTKQLNKEKQLCVMCFHLSILNFVLKAKTKNLLNISKEKPALDCPGE